MVSTRNRGRGRSDKDEGGKVAGNEECEYEESRAQRIKENEERMRSLGIFDLSHKLKSKPKPKPSSSSLRKTKPPTEAPSTHPPRRSTRLKDIPPVSYSEKKIPKKETSPKKVEIHIPEGENPEIYTDEHQKLLGDSNSVWDLCVDGYDEDGQRIYDPIDGKSCHQCRQKTLGHHTQCSKCKIVAGQFCGDCLYMRYGENVIEVNENPNWICPACRGICNCSRCRRDKGFEPTGAIYRKVVSLGFKSVAHYLIYTRRAQGIMEVAAAVEKPISSNGSLSRNDGNQELSGALSIPPLDGKKNNVEDDMELHSDGGI